jgi:hypothetical protein
LRTLHDLLSTTTRRRAAVERAPETTWKAVTTLLTGILQDSGLDAANEFLEGVTEILRTVVGLIKEATDRDEMIDAILTACDPENRETLLSAHRTTVEASIPRLTREEMDGWLADQYQDCLGELSAIGARSPAVTLAIDDTHEKAGSKYLNGAYSYIHVGQQSTWERGFKYPTVYDCTHQAFVGGRHQDYRLTEDQKRELRPWIRDLQAKCDVAREAGCQVAVIEGDRGYFVAELFAASHFGLFNPGAPAGDQPRVVVPRKFTREKDKFKWDYLLDGDQPQVFVDHLKLSPYTHPALRGACEGVFEKTANYCYLIPYACVAVVDEYVRGSSRTLAEAREDARTVQEGIDTCEEELVATEAAYFAHFQQYSKKPPAKPGAGKGKKREKFHDVTDKCLYEKCCCLRERLKKWKGKKKALLHSLMFFAISLQPGEDPTVRPEVFVALARDYHERWGVENGFRDVKGVFIRPTRSRKPTRRQFNLMLGEYLYDRWRVARTREILAIVRKGAWNKRPYDPGRPWVRRKLEQEVNDVVSARAYLARLWALAVKELIKKRFKGIS